MVRFAEGKPKLGASITPQLGSQTQASFFAHPLRSAVRRSFRKMPKRFASQAGFSGGAGSDWGVKSRSLGGGRRKVSMAVPGVTRVPGAGFRAAVVPGFTRRAGYFGRFNQPGTAPAGIQEKKFHDVGIADPSIAAGGTIIANSIVAIAQGLTESTRVGRKVVIRGINWRYRFESFPLATTAGQVPNEVRLILYLDQQANGAGAAVLDILETSNIHSFNNLSNRDRFKILMDRVIVLNPVAGAGGFTAANEWPGVGVIDSFYKKCNIPIEYSGTTGATAEIRSNNIGVLIVASVGATADMTSQFRIRFTDN